MPTGMIVRPSIPLKNVILRQVERLGKACCDTEFSIDFFFYTATKISLLNLF